MRQPRVPAATVARMIARREKGDTLAAIGRDYGITRERVRQLIARERGKPVKRWKRAERDEWREEMDRTYAGLPGAPGNVA